MIYRDDDICVHTDAHLFKKLHEEFKKRKLTHTVAVTMKDIWNNMAIFYYIITEPYLSVELHGWEHEDYSTMDFFDCVISLRNCLNYYNKHATRILGIIPEDKKITTLFAPWNKSSIDIIKACNHLGLKFCDVPFGEWEGESIKSLHWWNVMKEGAIIEDKINFNKIFDEIPRQPVGTQISRFPERN